MAEPSDVVPGLDAVVLTPLVRDALNDSAAVLEEGWSCHRLGGGGGAGLGVYRVAGHVRSREGSRPWSLVLKIFPEEGAATVSVWAYPRREVLIYGSGLLAALPGGFAAPRCFAVTDRPDGTAWVWLEAIADERPGPWPLDRHALAARHLGEFNGAYLAGASLPAQPWLAQGMVPALVDAASPAIADLDRLTTPGAPALVRQFYSPRVVVALRRLWSERAAFLGALERLPRTFCHGDAHRRNFFSRTGPDGTEQTVAIDWEYAGHGALGEEMAALVMSNLLLFEAAGIVPHDLDGTCFAAYIDGLRVAGWDGDPQVARLGYTGA